MTTEQDNLDIPLIITVGIVSTALTVASVLGVQALYLSYAAEEQTRKVTLASTADADSKVAEQDGKLASYGWVNRDEGQVVIPIERAMDLVVTEYESASSSSASDALNPELTLATVTNDPAVLSRAQGGPQ